MYSESNKRLDFYGEQSATCRAVITVYQPGSTTAVQNLTGCTVASLMIRKDYKPSSAPIVSLTVANGGLTLGGALGTVSVYITADQMQTFPVANVAGAIPPTQAYVYDLLITYPSGDIVRVAYGQFTVYAGVTTIP